MVTSCEIKFDNNPKGTFLSGSTLTGTVVLNLSEKKKFRGEVIAEATSRFLFPPRPFVKHSEWLRKSSISQQ